jgi:hypothetical protein
MATASPVAYGKDSKTRNYEAVFVRWRQHDIVVTELPYAYILAVVLVLIRSSSHLTNTVQNEQAQTEAYEHQLV